MKVKELKKELEKFDDETEVYRVYGRALIHTSDGKVKEQHMTQPLEYVIDKRTDKCLLWFVNF